MKTNSLSFVSDGKERMREAVNAQVRRDYERERAVASSFWQKIAIEKKIYREMKKQMKQIATPYSLWLSR